MGRVESKYSIEIVDPTGVRLADLSGRSRNRRISKSRNEADDIYWTLDLNELEAYCRAANTNVSNVLANGRNEVRVKRGNVYLAGGTLTYWEASGTARRKVVELRAVGFLNLLAQRYTSSEFSAVDGIDIAWQLINTSQAVTNGDFGITRGTVAAAGIWDKKYVRTSLKDAIKELAASPTRGFDFEFTHNKVFNCYRAIGSDRSKDIIFEAPGNIKEWALSNDATRIANEVLGIGSGNGEQSQTTYEDTSVPSQLAYKVRQKFLQLSNTDNEDGTLTDAVKAELAAHAFPFEIPSVTIDGNKAPYISDYGIGDRVRVRLADSDLTRHIDGLYRIERFDLTIDDDDNEEVKLHLGT